MKYFFFLVWATSLWACNRQVEHRQTAALDELSVQDCLKEVGENTFEVVTWNVENFPKYPQTISLLAELIQKMDVDVIALQEITSRKAFNQLLRQIPEWEGHIHVASGINLAYLLKKKEVKATSHPFAILKNETYALPRSPFVISVKHNKTGIETLLINNHFKAKGGKENEDRRKQASSLLENWIEENHSEDAVILLGDLNDRIIDPDNVFTPFLEKEEDYRFADQELAGKASKAYWSYPSYPSHIDHILISDELFERQKRIATYTFSDCLKEYKNTISDHLPLVLTLE